MKNLLLTLFLFLSHLVFSQSIIDTTKIISVRYEYHRTPKRADSTLTQILTKYYSGLSKREYIIECDKGILRDYEIFYSDNFKGHEKPSFGFLIMVKGDLYWQNYFDKYGNLDSIHKTLKKNDTLLTWNYKIEKKYKSNGKLKYLIDEYGNKDVYKYNLFGNLKMIRHFRDSKLYSIQRYKKGSLVSEKFLMRKKYRREFTYEYDKKGRVVKEHENDFYYNKYYYSDFGVTKSEKIREKDNFVAEFTIYSYSKNGILISKKHFFKELLTMEYNYIYE